jgi:hypothetical protein
MSTVLRTEIGLIMEVDNVQYELVQFSSDMCINAIPTAEVVIATGRQAVDGKTAATAHKHLGEITGNSIAKVYFCPKGSWDSDNDWPKGPHLIFEGSVLNVGYSLVMGKVQLLVRLLHWLGEMNNSSAVSSYSHPSNPSDYTFDAILSSPFRAAAGPAKAAGLGSTSAFNIITMEKIKADLWGNAIKPFFCGLGKIGTADLTGELKTCFGIEANDNSAALAALSRIEGVSGDACDLALSCYTPKLSLNETISEGGATVGDAILSAIMSDSIQSYASTTLWGKLVSYMATFGAAVVPQIDKALVVPFIPGIRTLYCKSIENCDYYHVNMAQPISQLLRGVVLMGSYEFSANSAPTSNRNVATLIGLGGCYAPEDVTTGMIKFAAMPAWLRNVPFGGHLPSKPIGLNGRRGFSSSTTPKEDKDDKLIANKDGKARDEIIRDTAALYDNYARYVYMVETLRGRFGSISGKLRFDIAPGSNVRIAGSAERFLQGEDTLAQDIIANVMRVSIGINAETSQAGTAFALSHIRTEAENSNDKFSIDSHPLYDDAFIGAPLLDALWFDKDNGCC